MRRCLGALTLVLAGVVLLACGGKSNPVSPSKVFLVLTQQLETQSILFRFSPGDSVDAEWQEQYDAWAAARLGVSLAGKINYYKYRDNPQMNSVVGRACCFAEPESLTIHTIWPRDNHEVVHLYSARIGSPTNFINEGLAVAFQTDPVAGDFRPRWNGTHVHTLAKSFRASGQLIPLAAMIPTSSFREHTSNISYPEAGSFIAYLIDTYGIEAVLGLFRGSNPVDTDNLVRLTFQSSIGVSLDRAEQDWHAFLDSWGGG